MPLFIAAFIGGLITAAASMVGRVLIAMGVGMVVFEGVQVLLDSLHNYVIAQLGAAGQIVGYVALFKGDVVVSIMFSAIAARLLLKGLTNGSLVKYSIAKPTI